MVRDTQQIHALSYWRTPSKIFKPLYFLNASPDFDDQGIIADTYWRVTSDNMYFDICTFKNVLDFFLKIEDTRGRSLPLLSLRNPLDSIRWYYLKNDNVLCNDRWQSPAMWTLCVISNYFYSRELVNIPLRKYIPIAIDKNVQSTVIPYIATLMYMTKTCSALNCAISPVFVYKSNRCVCMKFSFIYSIFRTLMTFL